MKLYNKNVILFATILLILPAIIFAQTAYHTYVDPFIGTEGDGNVVIGPSCPYGMIKAGPDFSLFSNSGYKPDTSLPLLGFSQVHVSGTGGGDKYGNISVMPFIAFFLDVQISYDQKFGKWAFSSNMST